MPWVALSICFFFFCTFLNASDMVLSSIIRFTFICYFDVDLLHHECNKESKGRMHWTDLVQLLILSGNNVHLFSLRFFATNIWFSVEFHRKFAQKIESKATKNEKHTAVTNIVSDLVLLTLKITSEKFVRICEIAWTKWKTKWTDEHHKKSRTQWKKERKREMCGNKKKCIKRARAHTSKIHRDATDETVCVRACECWMRVFDIKFHYIVVVLFFHSWMRNHCYTTPTTIHKKKRIENDRAKERASKRVQRYNRSSVFRWQFYALICIIIYRCVELIPSGSSNFGFHTNSLESDI